MSKSTKPTQSTPPAKVFRIGRLSAAIWERQSEKGVFHSVTMKRSFKEGDKWRDTDSFGHADLLAVAKLADLAHTWINDKLAGNAD